MREPRTVRVLNREEVQEIADKAATTAVGELMRNLGVDLHDQRQVNELRADLIHARKVRRMGDRLSVAVMLTIATGAVTGALTLLWLGFQWVVHNHVGWRG